jgi:chromosome segregation ATPase
VHDSVIDAGLPDVRESATRTERKLSELATEIQSIRSLSAAAQEAHSPRADEADEQLTGSEKGGARLVAEVEALHGRCDDAQKRTVAQKDDTSMIKESLDQLKGGVSQLQQSPVPAPQMRLLIVR